MRLPIFSFILAFLLLCGAGVRAQGAISTVFTSNLMLGSSGSQVLALQKLLNADLDTRISSAGPGSPGNETSYFGLLTKAAIIRFQEKYAGEILAPAGLTRGSGYVGQYTKMKLNVLSALSVVTEMAAPAPTPAVAPMAMEPENPNLKNLDSFFFALDTVAAEEGIPASELATIKKEITKAVATTTNLREKFLDLVQSQSAQAAEDTSPIGKLLATAERAFGSVFAPGRAHAAGGVPFGGALLFPFYCWNSNTWLLTIQPLPPTFVTLLSYVPGSQAFLSYNIPATQWLLGNYVPGGVCVFACPYCVTIPAEGTITPVVGSSPG